MRISSCRQRAILIVVEGDTDSPSRNHLLVYLAAAVYIFGYLGNGLLLITTELALIAENPINFIDPFLQLQTAWRLLTGYAFWQFIAITIVGYVLVGLSTVLVAKLRPQQAAIRWYWRRQWSLIFKAPLFIFLSVYGLSATLLLALTGFGQITGLVASNIPLLSLNVFRIYVIFLPLPILHLIWDNQFQKSWAKATVTILALTLLAGLNLAVDIWWGRNDV